MPEQTLALAHGKIPRFGYRWSDKMCGFGFKRMFEDARASGYKIVTSTRFVPIEPLPDWLEVDLESRQREVDVLLLMGLSRNIMMCDDAARAYYVFVRWQAQRRYEVMMDTVINKAEFDEHWAMRRIRDVESIHYSKYFRDNFSMEWAQRARDDNVVRMPCPAYTRLWNRSDGCAPPSFPFSLYMCLDLEKHLDGWYKPPQEGLSDRAVYVGAAKPPRMLKLARFGLPLDMYGKSPGEKVKSMDNVRVFDRVESGLLPELTSRYRCTLVTIEDNLRKQGWILPRIIEAALAGVPCLVHEDVFKENFGFTWLTASDKDHGCMCLSKETMAQRFHAMGDPVVRRGIWEHQREIANKVLRKFSELSCERLAEVLSVSRNENWGDNPT